MKYLLFIKRSFWVVLFVFFPIYLFLTNYSFIFKKKVTGEVVAVERVAANVALLADSNQTSLNSQIFSFSVGIKDRISGEIYMASSEDRQWAAVTKGNCVVAAYFPYAPWLLSKANTNHNARLLRNFTDCQKLPADNWIESIKFFFLIN